MLQKMSRRRRFRTFRRPVKQNDPKSKIEPNDHYQIVDIRLYFNLEGLKPQKYYKKIKKRQTTSKTLKTYFRKPPRYFLYFAWLAGSAHFVCFGFGLRIAGRAIQKSEI